MQAPNAVGRRPLTCHHEAGHALARWRFGHATHRVVVQTRAAFEAGVGIRNHRGDLIHCEGMVEGYEICDGPHEASNLPATSASGFLDHVLTRNVDREVDLIVSCAGYVAEARYRRWSPGACAFAGALDDLAHVRKVLDEWGLNEDARREAARLAEDRAKALVRSPRGWRAVKAMADALLARGELDGGEVARLCRDAYDGREQTRQAWETAWPPRLSDLRADLMPGPTAG
jgi:hypothetical protein